ncbi:acyltransferase family protein [Knoellia sp. CPCC 206453]|uniref:acyltransferase family protein n=1 Tax=Knoellia pratensis TaxID=3404796 RepID=UPI0036150763
MAVRSTHTSPPGAVTLIPALDGLRAVAAVMVVLTHAAYLTGFGVTGGLMGRLWSRGDFGVGIFFALSGFLLHRALVAHRVDGRAIAGYALRRAARVLPAYWVALAAVVVFANPPVRDWALHAGGLQIYVSDAWISSFGQSWSLATEISFYAALPLVVIALRPLRRRGPALPLLVLTVSAVALTLLSGIGSGEVFGQDILVHLWLHARAPQFLVGMICAEALTVPGHPLARLPRRWGSDVVLCLAIAGGAFLFATTPVAGALTLDPATSSQIIVRTALCSVVALALLLPLTQGRANAYSAALSRPPMRWLGVVSYGVFLWHLPVFTALYAVTGLPAFSGGLAPLLAVGIPITLLLSDLSHRWIEVPSSRLAGRILARQRKNERRQDQQPNRSLHG